MNGEKERSFKGKNNEKLFTMIILTIFVLTFMIDWFVKICTGLYYLKEAVVRWKFAIYFGECDDKTFCQSLKSASALINY